MELISPTVIIPLRMKSKYLETAQQRIPSPELLVNMVSRRARQLAQGHRPLTQTDAKMDFAEIALKEISEGKLSYEFTDGSAPEPQASAGSAE